MGPMEIILILVVALIIWGPGRIPEIARTVGKTMRTIRKTTTDLTSLVTKELDLDEKDRSHQPRLKRADKPEEQPDADKKEKEYDGTEATGRGDQ